MATDDDSLFPIAPATAARFWAKVDRRGESDCWHWIGLLDRDGYGRVKVGGKDRRSNRVAYAIKHGTAPTVVRHSCDNRACCNPAHLIGGTQQDNIADRVARNRSATGIRNGRSKLTPGQVQLLADIRASLGSHGR